MKLKSDFQTVISTKNDFYLELDPKPIRSLAFCVETQFAVYFIRHFILRLSSFFMPGKTQTHKSYKQTELAIKINYFLSDSVKYELKNSANQLTKSEAKLE